MIDHIYIINGPNLNLLGRRQPDLYGTSSFEAYLESIREGYGMVRIEYFQSNHEGDLIDFLHSCGFKKNAGIILNAGAYTHTSIALRDAIEAIAVPVIEVHITDIYSRESFRAVNYLKDVCRQSVIGKGLDGYRQAIDLLLA